MRNQIIVLAAVGYTCLPAFATVSVNLGINVPVYPDLQRIPDYPVYYVPRLHANYFFYDGLYWIYVPEGWYTGSWYNGPWEHVSVDDVPLFILRIPLRYYWYLPTTFGQWKVNAVPRWDAVWGRDWARRHDEWVHWSRADMPVPAPLPTYQQRFTRTNYPDDVHRRVLTQQRYTYVPLDAQARRHWQTSVGNAASQPNATQSRGNDVRPIPAHEIGVSDRRPAEHDGTSAREPVPSSHAATRAQPSMPPMQAGAPHGATEGRGQVRNARSIHNEHTDEDSRGEGHESDKHPSAP